MWVDTTATLTAVDGRAVIFEVAARDAFDEVGRCTHVRLVVDVAKIKERLQAKIAKARASSPA